MATSAVRQSLEKHRIAILSLQASEPPSATPSLLVHPTAILKISSGATISFIVSPNPVAAMMIRSAALALVIATTLSACEQVGIPDPVKEAARAQAEGEAIGSACRHAGRALEDCFTLNPRASKADIFTGWRNMNDYMIENKIDIVPPTLGEAAATSPAEAATDTSPRETESFSPRPRPRS
ncbi:hypothetical protein [Denitromonas iodatirespirans]|uniref:Uncharacterized protein n=1 Tax=Denitromonas iodatirespirans TaxID=2795389 RepID=A0A944DGP4_DENI1|nr:hypothetical protein [Denitromonas iodatirespirans]MBT0962523.1 hypothetical protein [Denitromonas iodatirespirans]